MTFEMPDSSDTNIDWTYWSVFVYILVNTQFKFSCQGLKKSRAGSWNRDLSWDWVVRIFLTDSENADAII